MSDLTCVGNTHPDRDYTIEFAFSEFTCINPDTDTPDFADLTIRYVPDRQCLDTVSLKQYLNNYREQAVFAQTAVNRVLDDLVGACAPRSITVIGVFRVRGGIQTTVTAQFPMR